MSTITTPPKLKEAGSAFEFEEEVVKELPILKDVPIIRASMIKAKHLYQVDWFSTVKEDDPKVELLGWYRYKNTKIVLFRYIGRLFRTDKFKSQLGSIPQIFVD